MKDLIVVQTKALALPKKRVSYSSKRYTRIALIAAILINVGTIFGLGVYIIERPSTTVSNTSIDQRGPDKGSTLAYKAAEEAEKGKPYVSYAEGEAQQELAAISPDSIVSVQSLSGENVAVASKSPLSAIADEQTEIDSHTAHSDAVDTTRSLSVAVVSSPVVASKSVQETNNELTTQATMDAALAIVAIRNDKAAEKQLTGDKSQTTAIIFATPAPKPIPDTLQPRNNNPMSVEQGQITKANDTKPGDPDDIHELRKSIAMIGTEFPKNTALNSSGQRKVTLNTNDALAIIVNSKNTQTIRNLDLRNYYTDKISEWDSGQKISIYHLPLESTARAIFAEEILKMSALEAATLESNRVITNRSVNPSVTKVSKLVKAFVARNPGAIGYIPLSDVADDPGIRVVMTLTQ